MPAIAFFPYKKHLSGMWASSVRDDSNEKQTNKQNNPVLALEGTQPIGQPVLPSRRSLGVPAPFLAIPRIGQPGPEALCRQAVLTSPTQDS